jgi:Fe-S cluster assembly iron-binding protein IscA
MLTLTDSAIALIRDLRAQPAVADDAAIRIVPKDGELSLSFVGEPAQGDQVVEVDDVRLFLQQEAAARLDDKVLDARTTDQGKPSFLISSRDD